MRSLSTLLGFIAVSHLTGIVGTFFTAPNIPTWYAGMAKPALNPPNWLFGPVWLLLYTLMGIAAWRVWQKRKKIKNVGSILRLFSSTCFSMPCGR